MATTADFRNGLCIEHNNDLFSLVEFQHVKPGKGGAFIRTKLKNLTTGKILEHTFNSGVKINIIRIERRPYQFLYKDESGYHFMHNQTFEQFFLEETLINSPQFLKEGNDVEILFHAEKEIPLSCSLPTYVDLKVTQTEPGLKGDTATNTLKPASLETGAIVKVPLFINEDDIIKVDTRTGEYSERAK